MGKKSAVFAVVLLLTAALAAPTLGARVEGLAKGKNTYIVVLTAPPAVSYEGGISGLKATKPGAGTKINPNNAAVRKYAAHLNSTHDRVLRAVGADPRTSKLYDYTISLNGFAATLTRGQAAKAATSADVWFIERDESRKLHTENSPDFLGLTAGGGLWDDLGGAGSAGEDVIVGIIDTGIWPEHPSFSDQADFADRPGQSGKAQRVYGAPPSDWHGVCVSGEQFSQDDCNNKLIGARYFRRGAAASAVIPQDYKSPRDRDGHGTHTASTAAGNHGVPASIFGIDRGEVSGMAPRARVAAYKVCWNDAGCFTSDIVAAIDFAVADGVDVINYSIGGSSTALLTSDSVGFLFAARAGVFVATSAGNSGPGASTVGNPAVVPWVTTVAASTQDRTFEATATLGGSSTVTGASVTEAVGSSPLVDSEDVGLAGADPDEAELCYPGTLDPAKVAGKIVLCLRGVIARVEKSRAVHLAGGAGMILYNPNDAQALVTDNHWVPSVHINNTDGLEIKAYIDSAGSAATAEISQGQAVPDADAPYMADFSSRGPNGGAMDIIKPDITAPGVNILAGNTPNPWLGRPGQLFQSISGTSMSSPHIAGLAALLVDAHPGWSPEAIKSALMTTAHQDVEKEDKTTPADPFDFGAGHVVPNSAVDPGLVYQAGFSNYLAFLRGVGALSGSGAIDPSNLNLASIAIAELVGSQTITRAVTDVTGTSNSWTASSSGLAGFNVVLPAPFTVGANATVPFEVTFEHDDATLGEWVFGAIELTDGSHVVRSPVALKAEPITVPSLMLEDAEADSGTVEWEVTVGFNGTLSADAYGAAADNALANEVVSQDPDRDIDTGPFTSGVNLYDFTLAAGVQYWAGGTFAATTEANSDLDVFLLFDEDNDGFDWDDDLIAFSADGDSEEIVQQIDPAAGDYRLIVHGWGTPDGASTYTLHRWEVGGAADPAGFTAEAGSGDPFAVDSGDVVPITLNYSGLSNVGTQYRGVVDYVRNGAANLGSTVVIIDR